MIPFTWSRGMLVVPLKFMCSTQWDTPVKPGRSSFDPTLYQHHTDASGAVCISCTRTVSPLSSITSRTGSIDGRAGTCVAMGSIIWGRTVLSGGQVAQKYGRFHRMARGDIDKLWPRVCTEGLGSSTNGRQLGRFEEDS